MPQAPCLQKAYIPAHLPTSWNFKLLFQLICQWARTKMYVATQTETESESESETEHIEMHIAASLINM